MEPLLKWAGGKRKLCPKLKSLLEEHIGINTEFRYFEPFFGGGALGFELCKENAVFNDSNKELYNVYKQIRNNPGEIIEKLKQHKYAYGVAQTPKAKEYYYYVRDKMPISDNIERAARTIFLNRTCFNGLYRVNKQGLFNVPIGKYKNPEILMESRISEISNYLNKKGVYLTNRDFVDAVDAADKGDIIYFDPPYDFENNKGFTSYESKGFSRDDLKRLKACCDDLVQRGCFVIISNNDTEFVKELFSDKDIYRIIPVTTKRMINSVAEKRTDTKEVIICAYKQ